MFENDVCEVRYNGKILKDQKFGINLPGNDDIKVNYYFLMFKLRTQNDDDKFPLIFLVQ